MLAIRRLEEEKLGQQNKRGGTCLRPVRPRRGALFGYLLYCDCPRSKVPKTDQFNFPCLLPTKLPIIPSALPLLPPPQPPASPLLQAIGRNARRWQSKHSASHRSWISSSRPLHPPSPRAARFHSRSATESISAIRSGRFITVRNG